MQYTTGRLGRTGWLLSLVDTWNVVLHAQRTGEQTEEMTHGYPYTSVRPGRPVGVSCGEILWQYR